MVPLQIHLKSSWTVPVYNNTVENIMNHMGENCICLYDGIYSIAKIPVMTVAFWNLFFFSNSVKNSNMCCTFAILLVFPRDSA